MNRFEDGSPRRAAGLRQTLAALLLTAAVGGIPSLHAQTADTEDIRRQLEATRDQYEQAQRRSRELQDDVAHIRQERESLNTQLIETAGKIQAGEGQMTAIEARLGELEAQEQLMRGSLEKSHGSISTLLAAMQRMGRNPPPVLVTRREDALSMVRSAMLLGSAFPKMRSEAMALSEKLAALVHVIDENRAEQTKHATETARLEANRVQLASLIETRKRTLAEREDELSQVRKAAAEITKNVGTLSDFLAKLEKIDKTVAEKTRLGAYEKKLAAAKALGDPTAAAASGATAEATQTAEAGTPAAAGGTPPGDPAVRGVATVPVVPPKRTAALDKGAGELRPSITLQPGENLLMAAPGRIEPAIPFEDARGRLRFPAQGNVIQRFGDQLQSTRSDGIVIETRAGAQVVSPNDGWIMYAGEFRSFGQILIVNAGGGYLVVLAGLSQVSVQVGQFVLSGEPVGVMTAAPKTASTKTQDNAPVLYVEFRKNQKPIDPGPWWAETARKVAG